MKTVIIPKKEYNELKDKAEISDGLLIKLVRGIEDIKHGRIKPWKRTTKG